MHGVGEKLPGLSDFVGCELVAVDDLESIVYFRFSAAAQVELDIGVENEWVMHDASGAVVASGGPRPHTPVSGAPLGSVVIVAETRSPKAIVLRFESGHTVEILDNADQYESFCIPHANVYI